MEDRIRVWLNDDREEIHHASAAQVDGMSSTGTEGITDCDRAGFLKLVHHENVDMGKLCGSCMAVTGVRPPLAGQDMGPV